MVTNGIDIIEIERIKKSMENENFKKRVFGSEELNQLSGRSVESYAGAFCAKEAFSKAVGTGFRNFELNEVQTLHNESGAPYLLLSGKALKLADENNLKFSLSISHCEKYAVAVVTAYTEE